MSGLSEDARGAGAVEAAEDPRLHPDRVRFAHEVGRSAVWGWQEDGQDFFGDRGASLLWGLPEGDTLSIESFRAALDPSDADRTFDALHRAAAPDGPERCQMEFRIHRNSDGAERWIALQGRRYPEGSAPDARAELMGMARDVTARKRHESHVHLLMREVTHRSKNLLAIIQAMARQTVKENVTALEFEQRFSARLRGLAASHELLAARDWHGAPVEDIVRWQLGPLLETAAGRIGIRGPEVFLNAEAAQNIGLAFNELGSNAARHGALSGGSGRVDVEWSLDPEGAEGRRFRIGWTESGGPQVKAPGRTGFGHKVVERLTARALDGAVDLSFPATGLRWSLHIPASFALDPAEAPIVN